MAHSGFKTGHKGQSGCFTCEICQRKTRNTGQCSRHLCGNCDEWTMAENSLNDNAHWTTDEEKNETKAFILKEKLTAAKRGGDRMALGLDPKPTNEPKNKENNAN